MTDIATIMTAVPSAEEAEQIAEALLVEKLAACVQIVPIRSRYVWKGEIQRGNEELLLIKTRMAMFDRVRKRIRALHSYDTPEVIVLPVSTADPDYLAWLLEMTRP